MCLQATIAYYLVVDFRRKNNSNAYLREEMVEANDVMLQHPSGRSSSIGMTHSPQTYGGTFAAFMFPLPPPLPCGPLSSQK